MSSSFAQAQEGLLDKKHTELLYSAKEDLHSPYYGYGFVVVGTPTDRIVGHGGGFHGISSNLGIHLDTGYISAVMSNYGGASGRVVDKIQELLERVE